MAARNRTGSPDKGSVMAPASGGAAVTPNDGTDLTFVTRGIYVGASGDVKVTTEDGSIITFVAMAAGIVHPIRAARIWSTGTTATSIVGVW